MEGEGRKRKTGEKMEERREGREGEKEGGMGHSLLFFSLVEKSQV